MSAECTLPLTVVGDSTAYMLALPADPVSINALDLFVQVADVSSGDTTLGAVLTNRIHASFPN